jgi:hypothetical protein
VVQLEENGQANANEGKAASQSLPIHPPNSRHPALPDPTTRNNLSVPQTDPLPTGIPVYTRNLEDFQRLRGLVDIVTG